MKTITIIFWSLLLAVLWATTSFADTGSLDGALDHVAQRSAQARIEAAPAQQALFGNCGTVADCAEHVEHSCQNCFYMRAGVVMGGRGGLQFIDAGHGVLAALGYAQDILDPPRL